jgi:hypothetical protein
VSLFEVPGFEAGLACALLAALVVGPWAGIRAAHRHAPTTALARAALFTVGLQASALAVFAAMAALRTACRPLAGAPLFALVAFPSGVLAAALGVLCGTAAGRPRRAAALYAAAAVISLAATLAEGYFGPSAAAYDHLLGWWPGPIYDEALEADRRLALFRLGTLAWAAAAVAAAVALRRRRTGSVAGPRRPAAIAALSAVAALGARAAGGGAATRAEIAAALGASRQGPRCTVHLARERRPSEAERALRDCEYDAAAVAGGLALAHPPHVTVWVYRSPEEKRRLVGAGRTSFTKPWLAEIHVHDEGVPHPLLRHELVHALASAAAPPPLRVPARALVLVDAGLLEGLAVALEVPRDAEGVHPWTRALRDQGRLPPLASLLGTAGFFGAAPARAYTASGSFIRFALERYGAGRVLAAYRTDDVPGALGRPMAELEAEWHRFLDGTAVSPALAARAEARFERGSVFERRCARELASLEAGLARAAASGDAARAEREARRAAALSGGDPAPLRSAADAWRAAGDAARAEEVAGEALAAAEAAGGRRALRAALLGAIGDLRLRAGDAAGAARRWRAALDLVDGGAEARTLRAKLAAAEDADLAEAVAPWLLGVGDPALALARLGASEAPLARYLLARARLARGAPAHALDAMRGVDARALPSAAFATEAARMRAEALCLAGRWDEGIAAWREVAAAAEGDGTREAAQDAAKRCAFEREEYGKAVEWEGDWPER